MLQHEINRFLDPLSRLHWNEVLKNNERVYKKLPNDYAIKHQIKLSHVTYHNIAEELQDNLDNITEGLRILRSAYVKKSVKSLKKFFTWFKDPKNHIVWMFTKGRKESFLANINQWTEEGVDLYNYLSSKEGRELRNKARNVMVLITKVPYVRHVSVIDHQNAF
jgi:hypothetical protein